MLPETPRIIPARNGILKFGRFAGPAAEVRLPSMGRLRDLLSRKRWIYVSVMGGDLLCAAGIVDAGYACKGFAFIARAGEGLIAQTTSLGVPRLSAHVGDEPEHGLLARYYGRGLRMRMSRGPFDAEYRLSVSARGFSIEATLDTSAAPEPIVAVSHLSGGGVHVTEKRVLMRAEGTARAGERRFALGGAYAGLDYTQGFLPRHTRWRWAYLFGTAQGGTPVALNLVEGFTGENECALWHGTEVLPIAEGHFLIDRENLRVPWRIRTRCGQVDLRFVPFGLHTERTNLLIARSRFLQGVGRYHGLIRVPGRIPLQLEGVLGVAEDQDTVW